LSTGKDVFNSNEIFGHIYNSKFIDLLVVGSATEDDIPKIKQEPFNVSRS
jgi:hypothetical protein